MADTVNPDAQAGLEFMRAAASGLVQLPPIARLLDWKPVLVEPGFMRVRYTATEDFYNPTGGVQGGILTAMLDDVLGPAVFTLLEPGQFCPTLEIKVSFIRPARAGTLVAEGKVVNKTGRFAHAEGRLTTEEGDLVATATSTHAIIKAELKLDER